MRQEVTKGVAQQYRPSSDISIIDLLRNVNPSDESFYKYIPNIIFEENSTEKRLSLTVTPQEDAEYMDAVKRGDMAKAQAMVDKAAESAGYELGN